MIPCIFTILKLLAAPTAPVPSHSSPTSSTEVLTPRNRSASSSLPPPPTALPFSALQSLVERFPLLASSALRTLEECAQRQAEEEEEEEEEMEGGQEENAALDTISLLLTLYHTLLGVSDPLANRDLLQQSVSNGAMVEEGYFTGASKSKPPMMPPLALNSGGSAPSPISAPLIPLLRLYHSHVFNICTRMHADLCVVAVQTWLGLTHAHGRATATTTASTSVLLLEPQRAEVVAKQLWRLLHSTYAHAHIRSVEGKNEEEE